MAAIDAPAPLSENIRRGTIRRTTPQVFRRAQFGNGRAQVARQFSGRYLVRENFSLAVNTAQRDEVIAFFTANGATWFNYQRPDLTRRDARFVEAPDDYSPDDAAGNHWTMLIAIEYYSDGLLT